MFSVNLQTGEKLITIYRQTEWALAGPILSIFIAVYFPAYLLIKYELLGVFVKWFIVWCVLVFLYGAYNYLLWLLNSYIITDRRLICVEYKTLFKKTVLECRIDKILNISYKSTGFFSSLLNFGDIEAQVQGLTQPMRLAKIRRPDHLKDFLWSMNQNK